MTVAALRPERTENYCDINWLTGSLVGLAELFGIGIGPSSSHMTGCPARIAGDGPHQVTLDQVIETMRQTGADMSSKSRQTSRGGLAVNVPKG